MKFWKHARIPLLAFTCANILLVFGRAVLDPSIGKRTDTSFVFPSAVPLPQWQLVASKPLQPQVIEIPLADNLVLPGHQYRYTPKTSTNSQSSTHFAAKAPLEITMRYASDTDGNNEQFIEDNTSIQLSTARPLLIIRHKEGLGFYGLIVHQQRAYLSACINSRGGSTFTTEQFSQNRSQYDMQIERILPWLLAQQSLRDMRCLWANLSIPLNQSSQEAAYNILENAWFSWYQWWHTRFPKA